MAEMISTILAFLCLMKEKKGRISIGGIIFFILVHQANIAESVRGSGRGKKHDEASNKSHGFETS